MILARVLGSVESTVKHLQYEGLKLLYVQPLDVRSQAPAGDKLIAVDTVDAGPGDLVLILEEGRSTWEAVGREMAPINRAVIGVVDAIEWFPAGGRERPARPAGPERGHCRPERSGGPPVPGGVREAARAK